jgi:hypothetical protein
MNFQRPSINGQTEREQIEQIKRHLFLLADQLNYVVGQLEKQMQEMRTEIAKKDEENV